MAFWCWAILVEELLFLKIREMNSAGKLAFMKMRKSTARSSDNRVKAVSTRSGFVKLKLRKSRSLTFTEGFDIAITLISPKS